ncbi:MAG: Hsp70 family protein, partial [Synergistaceae bacterium]|nr:Hsp70 family protein [Synergistaceae bacterium]
MSTAFSSVSAGLDVGSHTSKIASDEKIIAALPLCDFLKLREEAEIYFDEPVFSCVIAVSKSLSNRDKEVLIFDAKKSGFKHIELISHYDAILNSLDENENSKILVLDLGASKSEVIFFDNQKLIDSEIIEDVCGNEFDKIFSRWLSERFSLNLIKEKELLAQAENFKLELSLKEKIIYRDVEIFREDFERLIYFSVKKLSHVAERFLSCYSPKRFILTGGCCEIPIVKKIFAEIFANLEINLNLIAQGAAKKAASLSSNRERAKRFDSTAKFKEIRNEIITLEDMLTRKQKDRLYGFFRQIEATAVNNPALIKLLENLMSDIKSKAPR